MSTDTVDDLHAAEDMIGRLSAALERALMLPRVDQDDADAYQAVAEAAAAARDYCRPSCGFNDDGDCASGEATCGCPCEHGAEEKLWGTETRWIAIATEGVATIDGRLLEPGGIFVSGGTIPLDRPTGDNMLSKRLGPRRIRSAGNQWLIAVQPDDLEPDEWVAPTIHYDSIERRQEGDDEVTEVGAGELISAQVVKRDTLVWAHELLGVQ